MSSKSYYTAEEDALIMKHYPELGAAGMAHLLPGRSKGGIRHRAGKLNVKMNPIAREKAEAKARKNPKWTIEELETLKAFYDVITEDNLDKYLPGRNMNAVRSKAYNMGFTGQKKYRPKEDDSIYASAAAELKPLEIQFLRQARPESKLTYRERWWQ